LPDSEWIADYSSRISSNVGSKSDLAVQALAFAARIHTPPLHFSRFLPSNFLRVILPVYR
jgi:hypothetical protein